jgi:DNA-binding NtrC family response regulator
MKHLPVPISLSDLLWARLSIKQAVARLEERLIGEALEHTKGDRSSAARILGCNRTTLVMKLRKFPRLLGISK